MNTPKRYLTVKEVSEITNIKVTTLSSWRNRGAGPPFIKVEGALVRYPVDQFEEWLKAHKLHEGS